MRILLYYVSDGRIGEAISDVWWRPLATVMSLQPDVTVHPVQISRHGHVFCAKRFLSTQLHSYLAGTVRRSGWS